MNKRSFPEILPPHSGKFQTTLCTSSEDDYQTRKLGTFDETTPKQPNRRLTLPECHSQQIRMLTRLPSGTQFFSIDHGLCNLQGLHETHTHIYIYIYSRLVAPISASGNDSERPRCHWQKTYVNARLGYGSRGRAGSDRLMCVPYLIRVDEKKATIDRVNVRGHRSNYPNY